MEVIMNKLRNFFIIFLFCAGVSGLHAAQAELPHDVEIRQESLKGDDMTIAHELASVVDAIKNVFSMYISACQKETYVIDALDNVFPCKSGVARVDMRLKRLRDSMHDFIVRVSECGRRCIMPILLRENQAPLVYAMVNDLAHRLNCPMPIIGINFYNDSLNVPRIPHPR
jgi:hypothetical protein